ncbi:hypothetical protein Lesp02_08820 [Lentzea sp. NBRC 105346]|uniref:hypothetical protein n=1 Tax=Lentzea sp. NBRC 105346 TaxID=3032205 RepID=UPI0024A55DD8|nr:hypothetical protein [Lentzea sp. NBRC 105346]GLZ28692.1 hypothetical protein Lesp02_08820 [Lentzea sp. NBRC 105346]
MPLAPRTNKTLPSVGDEYRCAPPDQHRIGIALSGGGIRSAAFNLGAVQALQEQGVLANAEYLAAVSGGNYVASALAISSAHATEETTNGKPLWGRGSPEERYLRQHTDYLAPGVVGKLWMAASVITGFLLNYLPFVLCAVIAGRLGGWLLHALGLKLETLRLNGLHWPEHGLITGLLIAGGLCLVLPLVLVAYRRLLRESTPGNYGDSLAEPIAAWLLVIFVGIVVLLALPPLAELYATFSKAALSRIFEEQTFDTAPGRITIAVLWLIASLLLAAVTVALSRRFKARRVMLMTSSLAACGLLLVPLLSALDHAAHKGFQGFGDAVGIGVMVLLVLIMALWVHNRRYSMHLFYRERLNSAFALKRVKEGDRVKAEPIAFTEKLFFSDMEPRTRLPKLVVCCAVNVTTDDVPVGRWAESFTFERDRSGGPLFDYQETQRFEGRAGLPGTQLTLPSIMAVSGAAVSPLMGKFTYPPLRFLMALTNVRLGVWIKNPSHPHWARPRRRSRLLQAIRDGWFEPGALYVLREALGGARSTHRYIYLTDGGHWENLGLVELLRRRCTYVLCFDASCDIKGDGMDIGRAVALARSELDADIVLDPRPVRPSAEGFSEKMAVAGTVRYPDAQTAKLVYAKAVLTEQAPWDLHAFKARDGRFPNHSTSQQMFTDEEFEAYRSLGYSAGLKAVECANLPAYLTRPEPSPNGSPRAATHDEPADLAGGSAG